MDEPGLDTIRLVPRQVEVLPQLELTTANEYLLPDPITYTNINGFFTQLSPMVIQDNMLYLYIRPDNTFDPNTLGRLYIYGNAIYEQLDSILSILGGINIDIMHQIFAFLVPNVTRYRPNMDRPLREQIPTRVDPNHTDEDIDLRIDRIIRILYYLNSGFNRLVIVDRINVGDRQVNIGYMVFLHNTTTGQVVHLFHIHPIMMINPDNETAEIPGGVMIMNDQDQQVRQYVFENLLLLNFQIHIEIERRIRQAMTVNYMGITNVHLGAPYGFGQIMGRAAQRGAGEGLFCGVRYLLRS